MSPAQIDPLNSGSDQYWNGGWRYGAVVADHGWLVPVDFLSDEHVGAYGRFVGPGSEAETQGTFSRRH
jgi:hypothetical protein